MDKSKEVYKIVSDIPVGQVMTYGQIGGMCGINPRQVGRVLHANPDPENISCHRVVNALGKVAVKYAFGGGKVQAEKLLTEGIEVEGDRVDLQRYRWQINQALRRLAGQLTRGKT